MTDEELKVAAEWRQDRPREDDDVRHVPRSGSHGRGRYAANCRPIAELHRAATLGYSTGDAARRVGTADEAHRRQPDRTGSGVDCGVRGIANTDWRGRARDAN